MFSQQSLMMAMDGRQNAPLNYCQKPMARGGEAEAMSWVSAGYLLIRPAPRPQWPDAAGSVQAALLPQPMLSASNCLCSQFPGTYAIDWCGDTEAERERAFDAIALDSNSRAMARTWATEQFGQVYGWPGVFYDLENAIAAKQKFFPNDSNLRLIALGLPAEFRETFIAAATPAPPPAGFAPAGKSGYLETLERNHPVLKGGVVLGYELLNIDVGQVGCSWLCNGLERHCAKTLGITPNCHGLIDTLPLAQACLTEITKPAVGAEPGLWLPFALVRFSAATVV
ncbi:MAG: hypothetical protein AAF215_17025 [Cyanobacteria bacterium P01_A01_bin.123]